MQFPVVLSLSLLPALVLATFRCSAGDPTCLESFFNLSSIADAFLGDHGTVIFQNGLLKTGNGTNACPAMSVIFARGTDEPGNVGFLTGPPFFAALAAYISNTTTHLAIQGVDYPADIPGFLAGGSVLGAFAMAALINHTLSNCPNTQLTLSGYSQGAQVVHLAAAKLPANTTAKIASVVLFGDPKNGTVVQGVDAKRVLTVCHAGDDICKGGDKVGVAHLNYSSDATAAAMFTLGGAASLGITSGKLRDNESGGLG